MHGECIFCTIRHGTWACAEGNPKRQCTINLQHQLLLVIFYYP